MIFSQFLKALSFVRSFHCRSVVPLLANIFLVLHFKLAIIKMADNSFGCNPKVKHRTQTHGDTHMDTIHGYGYALELSGLLVLLVR